MSLQLFVMGEVAVELFQESPTAFLQVGCFLHTTHVIDNLDTAYQ